MGDGEKSKMYLTDLEFQLADDEDGSLRDRICADLDEQGAAVKRAIDGGLSPEDFQIAEKLQVALGAAQAVVRETWKAEHQQTENRSPFFV